MKKLIILSLIIVAGILLAGCEEPKLKYKGETRPAYQVEEIIENELELENPGLDLDVSIMQGED